ncbi:MAG: hypothetical protein M5R37_09500 [Melioribacteraceae bacterium]|nr:hypothetical protein [Melioribacteraceae bacterium]
MSKDKEIESVLFDEKGMFELIENEKRNTDKISLINEIIKRRAKKKEHFDPEKYYEGITIDDKLAHKLSELEAKPDEVIKSSYDLKDKIWWKGSEPMIIYLFDLLISANLIDGTQARQRNAIIAKHYKNIDGKEFDNKQLGKSYSRMKNKKPNAKDTDTIEQVLREIRQYLKEEGM